MRTYIIAGASGLIGTAIIQELLSPERREQKIGGMFQIIALSRSAERCQEILQHFRNAPQLRALTYGQIIKDPKQLPLSGSIFINLAGENIGLKRLNARRMTEIIDSRLQVQNFFKKICHRLSRKPELFIQASALSALADNDVELSDDAPRGENLIAKDLALLEETTQDLDCKTLCLRLPLILSPEAPFCQKLHGIPALWLLDGSNYLPAAALSDCARAFIFAAEHSLSGTLNFNAPHYLTAKELLKALGNHHLPTLPVLRCMLNFAALFDRRILLLLENKKILSCKLLEAGFKFHYENPLHCLSRK